MRFKNYFNQEAKNGKIYSKNDIRNMTLNELFQKEKELAYQYYTLGIPEDEELENSINTEKLTDDIGKACWNVKF